MLRRNPGIGDSHRKQCSVRTALLTGSLLLACLLLVFGQFGLMLLHQHVLTAYEEAAVALPQPSLMLFGYLDWLRTGEGVVTLPFPAWIAVVPLALLTLIPLGLVLARTARMLASLLIFMIYAVLAGQLLLLVLPYINLMQELLEGGGI